MSDVLLCSKCATEKPETDFARERRRKTGRQAWCKLCQKSAFKVWFDANVGVVPEDLRKRTRRGEGRDPLRYAIADGRAKHRHKMRYRSDPAFRATHSRKVALRRYGLTPADFDAMFARQGGRCGLCRTDTPRFNTRNPWHVDHDHATGKVRSILCGACNIRLGSFEHLIAAVDLGTVLRYLDGWPTEYDVTKEAL